MPGKQSTKSAKNSANQASSIDKNHQLLEYNAKEKFLRITLDFMNDIPPIFFDRLIETLPNYRSRVTSTTIRMIFKPKDKDDLSHTMARHGILDDVVDRFNNFPCLARVHFVLNLDYLSLSQIEPASAIYSLNFKSWTFDILTDDVEHVLHDSAIDMLLRAHYERNAPKRELSRIKRMLCRSAGGETSDINSNTFSAIFSLEKSLLKF